MGTDDVGSVVEDLKAGEREVGRAVGWEGRTRRTRPHPHKLHGRDKQRKAERHTGTTTTTPASSEGHRDNKSGGKG